MIHKLQTANLYMWDDIYIYMVFRLFQDWLKTWSVIWKKGRKQSNRIKKILSSSILSLKKKNKELV